MATTVDLSALNGPTIHFLNVANELARSGHDVSILTSSHRAATGLPVNPKIALTTCAAAILRLGVPNSAATVGMLGAIKSHPARDALYVRSAPGTLPLVIAGRRHGFRRIAVEANGWFHDDAVAMEWPTALARLAERIQIAEARRADAIRVVTAGLGRLFQDAGIPASRLHVVGNGTDLKSFRPISMADSRAKFGVSQSANVACFVGNLWPSVDFETMFAAIDLLRKRGRPIELQIVGDGPLRRTIEAQALNVFGSEITVRFHGHLPPHSTNEVLATANVALAPFVLARNERIGLSPLKLRDYAAAGKSVVATAIGGIADIGNEPWLFLAQPENSRSFADAIEKALTNTSDTIGRMARAYAEEHFSWAGVAEQVSRLLR